MRRILLILTVAALMAAMMVSAGPAKADSFGNNSNFNTGFNAVQINDSSGDIGDDFWWDDDDLDDLAFAFGDFWWDDDDGTTILRVG